MYNHIVLVGNIGSDGQIKTFEGGSTKLSFTLATSDGYYDKKNNNQWVEQTDWHNVEVWNPSEYLTDNAFKGSRVLVEGKLKCNSYDDANGQKRYYYFIKASFVRVLGQSRKPNEAAEHPAMNGGFGGNDGAGNEDLPF